jgi:hypothetical protein
MRHVILLNGPKESGKDTIAEYFSKNMKFKHDMFKRSLYEIAAIVAGVSYEVMFDRATNRDAKDSGNPLFRIAGEPVTPRQWLIHVSENVVKPLCGKSYFGDTLLERILKTGENDVILVSDSGFEEEALALLDKEIENLCVSVIRIHRPGYTFEGDSRKYLTNEFLDRYQIPYIDLHNDDTLRTLFSNALTDIEDLIYYHENMT